MGSIFGLLFAVAILCGPPLSFVGLLMWARRLRASNAPRARVVATQALAATIAILLIAGDAFAFYSASHRSGASSASEKARDLAETISELMNSNAFVLLVAIVGFAGLALWSRLQLGPTSQRPKAK